LLFAIYVFFLTVKISINLKKQSYFRVINYNAYCHCCQRRKTYGARSNVFYEPDPFVVIGVDEIAYFFYSGIGALNGQHQPYGKYLQHPFCCRYFKVKAGNGYGHTYKKLHHDAMLARYEPVGAFYRITNTFKPSFYEPVVFHVVNHEWDICPGVILSD